MLEVPAIRRGALLLASVAIAALYLWGLGDIGFLDPDEGMYAEIAREMLASGDWIVPRFNGVPYVEKPPLMYWLTAGTYALLGPSEFSARLWKVIPALGTAWLTYRLGRLFFSKGVGILSALVLATTLGSFLFSRITQMDPLLVFGITLSVLGILEAGGPDPGRAGLSPWRAGMCFWTGISIGVLSKGLPGLLFPLALLVLWAMIHKDTRAIRGVCHWGVVALAVALIVPWHVAVSVKVPGFLEFYLLDNQFLRFLGERAYLEDGKSLGTLAFLAVTLLALFPWTPFLAAALMAHSSWLIAHGSWLMTQNVRGLFPKIVRAYEHTNICDRARSVLWTSNPEPRTLNDVFRNPNSALRSPYVSRFTFHDSRIQFLAGWIGLVIGFFAVSSFKLEYYGLPAFPAVALLVAAFFERAEDVRGPTFPKGQDSSAGPPAPGEALLRVFRVWTWVAIAGGVLFTVVAAWVWWAGLFTPLNIVRALSIWATNYRVMLEQGLPFPPVSPGYFSGLLLGGGLMWTAGFAAGLCWLRRGQVLPATLLGAMVGVGLCVMAASVLRQVESHHSLKPLAQPLKGALRPEDVLVHERGLEKGGGLLFYTGRQALVLNGTRGDLDFGSRLPEYRRTFIDTSAFRNLWAGSQRVFLVTGLPPARSAISAMSNPPPILLASTGTRWLYANRLP